MSGLVQVAEFQDRVRADLARLVLEAEGVTAIAFDEGMNNVGLGPIVPVRLMVLEAEVKEAAAILAEEGLL